VPDADRYCGGAVGIGEAAVESTFVSLLWIALCAVIAPLLAGLVPRRLVPEVVILLVAGVLIGPFGLGLATTDDAIGILRELGLGMLFLWPATRSRSPS